MRNGSHKDTSSRSILPGSTIGILGGGQLGRMMAIDGRKMGYRFATLDPTPGSPCAQVSDKEIVAAYSDTSAAEQLALASDVITYEFENVDADVAAILEERADVPQGSHLLFTTQHRLREKTAIEAAGVPVARYQPVSTKDELRQAVNVIGTPAILKTTMGGYDGKGQWTLESENDIDSVWSDWHNALSNVAGVVLSSHEAPLILEQRIPFVKELSVVVARGRKGQVVDFPVAENIHRHHILHMSIVPAHIRSEVQQRAAQLAVRIAESLGVVGLLAVEMFLTADDELYVNELAPRPHNSGHYTMDACMTSQFEQHLRAICGLPLGSPKLLSPIVMVNILGEHLETVMTRITTLPCHMKIHLYGKAESKSGRKMGHINVLADTVDNALRDIASLGIWD